MDTWVLMDIVRCGNERNPRCIVIPECTTDITDAASRRAAVYRAMSFQAESTCCLQKVVALTTVLQLTTSHDASNIDSSTMQNTMTSVQGLLIVCPYCICCPCCNTPKVWPVLKAKRQVQISVVAILTAIASCPWVLALRLCAYACH